MGSSIKDKVLDKMDSVGKHLLHAPHSRHRLIIRSSSGSRSGGRKSHSSQKITTKTMRCLLLPALLFAAVGTFQSAIHVSGATVEVRQVEPDITCSVAGFFAHPADCTRFYRCVDFFGTGERFSIFFFDCPAGTIFDEALSICNHPEWVQPLPICMGGGGQTTTLVPDTTNESNTIPVTDVPVTSTALPTSQPITSPEPTNPPVTSPGPINPPITSPEPTNPPITTEQPAPTAAPVTVAPSTEAPVTPTPTAAPTNPPPTNLPTDVPPSTLPTEAPLTTLPTAATTNPKPTEVPTPAPTNPPPTQESSSALPTPAPTSAPDTVVSPTKAPVTTTSAPFVLTCGSKKYYRHPLRCELYYQCLWNGVFSINILACPDGTFFDEDMATCLPPDQTAPCHPLNMPMAGLSPTPASTTDQPSTTTAPSQQYTLAPGSLYNCKQPGHFPYELDCIRFYRCFEVQPGVLKGLLYRCPTGYGYDTKTERCQKQQSLPPVCDRTNVVRSGSIPIPIVPLEDTTAVRVEDLDSFFHNVNSFYLPRG